MILSRLLTAASLPAAPLAADPEITAVTEDSRTAVPGALFVAIAGNRDDGARYAADAIGRGAVAVVAGSPAPGGHDPAIPWLQVAAPRAALARLSAAWFGFPGDSLTLTAVTGSKGKTTTCFLAAAVAEAAGEHTALLSTAIYRTGLFEHPASLTTPSATRLQELLHEAVRAKMRGAVIEVSSHALDQDRVTGLRFEAGIFTNLFPDHQDYHQTVDEYFEAKRRLFAGPNACARAAIGIEGRHGKRLAAEHPHAITFGPVAEADVRPLDVQVSRQGTKVVAEVPGHRQIVLDSPLLGRFNAQNLLGAVAYGLVRGFDLDAVREGVRRLECVPGRMEPVERGQPFTCLVDYSHTGPALKAALEAVREWTSGRVGVVFGAGGNRDRARRRELGEAAARLADQSFLTSDNPRDEDPDTIIREIHQAFASAGGEAARVFTDRAEAIAAAVAWARPGDTVLVAGKGHETWQIAAGVRRPFDDRLVLAEALVGRGYGG